MQLATRDAVRAAVSGVSSWITSNQTWCVGQTRTYAYTICMADNHPQEYGSIARDYGLPFDDYMDGSVFDGFMPQQIGDVLDDVRFEYLSLGQKGVTGYEHRRTLFGWLRDERQFCGWVLLHDGESISGPCKLEIGLLSCKPSLIDFPTMSARHL